MILNIYGRERVCMYIRERVCASADVLALLTLILCVHFGFCVLVLDIES